MFFIFLGSWPLYKDTSLRTNNIFPTIEATPNLELICDTEEDKVTYLPNK